ncbi:MAG: TMEM43 family protein [Prevotellaceae bacterium]|nr:TMEM43 family protein [Candidatus Minthosoma caballi]
MAYTEKRTVGYGERVKNSFGGVITGIIMFVAGTWLLGWNEGRAVKTAEALKEGAGVAIEMESIKKVDPSFDGELVHATGMAETTDSLYDSQFGVGAISINLEREVEYYQWVEHQSEQREDKLGGSEEITTTYTYSKEWVSEPQNSSNFKDPAYAGRSNAVLMQLEDQEWTAEHVTFGAYTCPASMISKIGGSEKMELSISDEMLKAINAEIARVLGEQPIVTTPEPEVTAADSVAVDSNKVVFNDNRYENIHVSQNQIYLGKSPNSPAVGDVRISYTVIYPHKISIIAQVSGNTFKQYKAKNGKTLMMVHNGVVSMEEMFQSAEDTNEFWTWVLRIFGILLVCGGLKGLFGFLETLLKVVPFLSSIFSFGVGIVTSVIGIVWSLLVIAIAWLFYRPVLAICILVGAGVIIFLIVNRGKVKAKLNEAKAKKEAEA